MALVSHVLPKKTTKKIVMLLSTMHQEGKLENSGKPEIIEFYSKMKGVDTFDLMCTTYSSSHKTMFYVCFMEN